MSSNQLVHRNVYITLNLKPTLELINAQFLRLIEMATPLFTATDGLGDKVQKRWYGKQFTTADTLLYGYFYFTITNRAIMDPKADLTDPEVIEKGLEFTFHIKQIITASTVNNFTAGSVRYKKRWGEFNNERTELNLVDGTDVENAVQFRDLIKLIGAEMTAFTLDDETLIGQNNLELLPVRMAGGDKGE